jgi:hypothetical protein
LLLCCQIAVLIAYHHVFYLSENQQANKDLWFALPKLVTKAMPFWQRTDQPHIYHYSGYGRVARISRSTTIASNTDFI